MSTQQLLRIFQYETEFIADQYCLQENFLTKTLKVYASLAALNESCLVQESVINISLTTSLSLSLEHVPTKPSRFAVVMEYIVVLHVIFTCSV